MAGLAWVPFWYGGNDLIAWGINAIWFPGLSILYEISLAVSGESHPAGIKSLAAPAALFVAVVVWIGLQTLAWPHLPFANPIWGVAAETLGRPLDASISVNRDLTVLALVRLLTAASVFWLALQLCRNPARASLLVKSVAAITAIYAAYGLAAVAFKAARLPWLDNPSAGEFVTSTFVNHNSFATYSGLGLVAMCGLIWRLYQREAAEAAMPLRLRIAALIDITGRQGAALIGGTFLILVALLFTGSRGGVAATGLGLLALAVVTFNRGSGRGGEHGVAIIFGLVVIAATLFAFGDVFFGSLSERGVIDTDRLSVYLTTLRSIFDAPFLGYGYGTFADVFPMYRDRSISVQGTWEQAHDTYLEGFQGLGLIFGAMLVASVVLLVLRCVKGATRRQGSVTAPRVAAGAAVLVGGHALVDFSLQMQAVALTFMAVLGAGVAQSESSRRALDD